MDTPTFLEVEVERDAVASVLDVVPGVAVVDDATDTDPAVAMDSESADDSTGLTDRLASLWRQWGLLGTGLSLIALGAATAGLWWYRRRGEDTADSGDEYEWDADSGDEYEWDDSAVDTPAPSESPIDARASPGSSVDTPSPGATATGPEAPDEQTETPADTRETALAGAATGRSRDDRRRDTGVDSARSGTVAGPATDQPDTSETDDGDERPGAKIDPAPLLGAAFLIVTSAIGRWVTRDRSDET